MADKLIITAQFKDPIKGQLAVRINGSTYDKLMGLHNKTGKSIAYIVGKIVDFALPLIEIREDS